MSKDFTSAMLACLIAITLSIFMLSATASFAATMWALAKENLSDKQS